MVMPTLICQTFRNFVFLYILEGSFCFNFMFYWLVLYSSLIMENCISFQATNKKVVKADAYVAGL